MGKTLKKLAVATGIAALAGYLAGVLTAPKSGKETRADIKHAAQTGMSEAEKQLKNVVSELGQLIDEAKQRGVRLGDKANAELEGIAAKAKAAREKAREVLSAIHEGDAADKDLNEAVNEATSAIKHLRTYLKK